ncbi:MAG: hypothetical protein E7673_06495 [Ruminococcaceae bacterium]|nr:hypothetical protein [Oscillospiraceae bacterium]
MSSIYKRIGNYVLVEKQGLFGLSGKEGEMLLPCEYDSIFHEGGGFIITKNSKSGYIKFREQTQPHSHDEAVRGYPEKCAQEYLPCTYDRIEPTRNGLVLHKMTNDEYYGEKREWYDYKLRKVYKNLRFRRNYGEFDNFIDIENPNDNSILKIAGTEQYFGFPVSISGEILYEVPLYNGGAHYFVCCEELSDDEAERKGYICEYFFLIILSHTYTFSEPKPKLALIFDDFPRIVDFWDREAKKEREHAEHVKSKKENGNHKKEI